MAYSDSFPSYRYAGARAMVILHDRHLRSFIETWKRAKGLALALPRTDDSDYVSLETLLVHLCRAARGYMVWMCEVLQLPDPRIEQPPGVETIELEIDAWIDHLGQQWRIPLADVPEERFGHPVYPSRWNVLYCIDAMLEHAVMHPIRHEFQLERLLSRETSRP